MVTTSQIDGWGYYNILIKNTKDSKHMICVKRFITLSQGEICDFEPISILGSGGYGSVFKCWSPKLKRFFAVKKSQINESGSEMGILQKINIEGFCHHYDVIRKLDFQYLISECCDGTLADIRKKINVSLSLNALCQISQTLAAMHEQNAYHGDIKQNNILFKVEVDKIVFLVNDFGFSSKQNQRNSASQGRDVISFFRMIYRMAGLDTEKFPKDIDYPIFRMNMLAYLPKIKTHWRKIFEYILTPQLQNMANIHFLIKNVYNENKPYFPQENISEIFCQFKKPGVIFQLTKDQINVDFSIFYLSESNSTLFDRTQKEGEHLEPIIEENEELQESIMLHVPKKTKFTAANKKRRVKSSQRNDLITCKVCSVKHRRKDTRHLKNLAHQELQKVKASNKVLQASLPAFERKQKNIKKSKK